VPEPSSCWWVGFSYLLSFCVGEASSHEVIKALIKVCGADASSDNDDPKPFPEVSQNWSVDGVQGSPVHADTDLRIIAMMMYLRLIVYISHHPFFFLMFEA